MMGQVLLVQTSSMVGARSVRARWEVRRKRKGKVERSCMVGWLAGWFVWWEGREEGEREGKGREGKERKRSRVVSGFDRVGGKGRVFLREGSRGRDGVFFCWSWREVWYFCTLFGSPLEIVCSWLAVTSLWSNVQHSLHSV